MLIWPFATTSCNVFFDSGSMVTSPPAIWFLGRHKKQHRKHRHPSCQVTALEGGDLCFTQMLQAISQSQSRVWCESYIFDNSRAAQSLSNFSGAKSGAQILKIVKMFKCLKNNCRNWGPEKKQNSFRPSQTSGRVAEIFFTALRDAARRGLDVVLLVDYIGAFALRQETFI